MTESRILIVEDEGILAKGLEVMLRRGGYALAGTAATGEEAVAMAAEAAPDLVLMDVRLRGEMDGIEAARRIRGERDIPVVYLTAFSDEETVQRAKDTVPHGYLVKPVDERLLLITVEMALSKHQSEKALSRAARELEQQKHFFETLFQSIPSPVLVVDSQNRVRAANPLVEELFGLPAGAILGRLTGEALSCSNALVPGNSCGVADCAASCPVRSSLLDTLVGKQVRKVKAEFRSGPGGTGKDLQLLVSASPVEIGGEALSILILEDVTELHNLKRILRSQRSFCGIVGADERMGEIFATIREVANSAVPVLIQGESGTGKELVALAIHTESPRARKHFVAVNCGALPDGLLESELFGHVRGAFTGAVRDKKGRFELADGGTLFLDEIGELSIPLQVKLLRVLQNGAFERVGGEQTIRSDVRIVSATNKDLAKEVASGRFRGDLYYRLCVMPIHIPPLRERREDIPLLAEHLLLKITRERGLADAVLTPEALDVLMRQPWPGNVRQLENALQYALLKCKGEEIRPEHLPPAQSLGSAPPAKAAGRRRKLTGKTVAEALRAADGNKVKAARALGVGRATLYRFLEQHPQFDLGAASGAHPAGAE
jgi:DNA-binding NtrC family response regulator